MTTDQTIADPTPRIAIVEDEPDLRDNTLRFLAARGYTAWGADSAESFYRQFAVQGADIVVLDIGLPGEDGFSVTSHLRQGGGGGIGIVIVSARGAVDDRLQAMGYGADLYLVKPVDLRELAAGIDAVWRRLRSTVAAVSPHPGPAERGGSSPASPPWRLDRANWSLIPPEGIVIPLTPREYAFVLRLAEKSGEPVPKAHVVLAFGGEADYFDFHRIEVMVSRLRRKVREVGGIALPIKTVPGFGFVFTVPCEVA